MFSNFFLKSFRILLFPFAIIYWIIIGIRNFLYDHRIFRSTSFGLPVICIGNLAVGGTGKSPMVEYLTTRLLDRYKLAILSRGYKRKTKGYALAHNNSTALEIGDEPMQFHTKFPGVPVAVGEARLEAIPQLLHDHPEVQCIILDDAFQHRAIDAGLNILLTDCNNLFTRDFYLPTGDLRDLKSSYKRAQVIVVTKCEHSLTDKEKNEIIQEIDPGPGQQVFFTANQYGNPYHILRTDEIVQINTGADVLLLTGIANPAPLKKLLYEYTQGYDMMHFPDHHIFSIDDLKDIRKRFKKLNSDRKYILTTEKDAMRLIKFGRELEDLPIYVIPLAHHFLFGEGEKFLQLTIDYIERSLVKNREQVLN